MKYDPKDAYNTLEAGEYPLSIKSAVEDVSKTGNTMMVVEFEVYDGTESRTLKDYFPNSPRALWKYRMLAEALNAKQDFNVGTFDARNFIGANLVGEIVVESDAKYGEQNKIKALKPSPSGVGQTTRQQPAAAAAPGDTIQDSDIPFD